MKTQAEQMKVQFGSALANEAKANAYITIPGLRGMPAKEISVKNLANIIQARMSEIMDFVTYHLKQVGLDNQCLNGGIILTGGGSQLKHLIQLNRICNRVDMQGSVFPMNIWLQVISKNWPNQLIQPVSGLS